MLDTAKLMKAKQILSSAFEVHGKDKVIFCDESKLTEAFACFAS